MIYWNYSSIGYKQQWVCEVCWNEKEEQWREQWRKNDESREKEAGMVEEIQEKVSYGWGCWVWVNCFCDWGL